MLLLAILLLLQAAPAPAQTLSVTGAIKTPLTLAAKDLAKMPRATVTTKSDTGSIVYEGVWLVEVLKRAGASVGEDLRGKSLAGYVLASAADGYQVVFSMGEVDPALSGNEILVADSADGKPLFGRDGTFRLIVPKDKRGARSIRMLTKLEVVQLRAEARPAGGTAAPGDAGSAKVASGGAGSAKVELGRHLFYDVRLSGNGKQSCATCHRQELAFTDGRGRAVGSTGEVHPRGSMSLVNVAYSPALTWNNPELKSLEEQARIPMFGHDPVELGTREADLLAMLAGDPVYRRLFADAGFSYSVANVVASIATFERTIVSTRSPYDRYRNDRQFDAISDAAKRGEIVYFSGELGGCFECHGGGRALSGNVGKPGLSRAPTLRNIVLTAPYMHDGNVATLSEAILHDTRHARNLNEQSKQDLIEFLKSLTDDELLHDPAFANPWRGY